MSAMCFCSEASYIANMFCTKFKKSIKAMRRNVSGEEAGIYDTTPGKSYRTSANCGQKRVLGPSNGILPAFQARLNVRYSAFGAMLFSHASRCLLVAKSDRLRL